MTNNRETETHESYGMLLFSRGTHGSGVPLFGSSIMHSDTIRLSIAPGEAIRHLNADWYHNNGKDYIQVEMSQAQFAEAISSMNVGSGVPVTVRRLNGKQVKEPNFTNKRIQFEKEFEDRMVELDDNLKTLIKNTKDVLHNKKSISKGDRTTILNELNALQTELASNIPYITRMYNEQLDKTTHEAKAEIEAYTMNKINTLGLEKLRELNALPESNNSKQIKD